MVGFFVARLALLIIILAIGLCGCNQRRCQRRTGADGAGSDLAKEITAADGCFLIALHRFSPGPIVGWSVRERKCFSFDFQKQAAELAYRSVEFRARRVVHVGEQSADPGCDVLLKKGALCRWRCRKAP